MNPPKITAEGKAARNKIAEVRQNVDSGKTIQEARSIANANPYNKTETWQGSTPLQPSVSATDLANPTPRVQPPVPQVNTNDGSRTQGLIDNTATNTQGFITAQSEEATRAKELAGLLGSQTFDGAGQRAQLGEQYGLPANMQRLQDIQTQLTKRNEQSAQQKALAVSGGAGTAQAQRALTLEDRQNAIRNAGLAAEANVLQGNIETASTLINQAMSDYYQDRTLQNQNMIQQLNYFSGIADKQTAQLLEKEKRVYEEDQRKVQRVQNTVDAALASGAATANDMKVLTDPKTTDEERLALSQLIVASGAKQERDMDLAVKAQQLAKLREPVVATRETSVVDVNGTKQLIDTQTGEVIATFGADVTTDEITNARDTQFVNTVDTLKNHPGMSKAVGTTGLARWTPFKADVMTGQVSEFVGSVENVTKQLTLNTFAEAKEKGITFGAGSEGEWKLLGESATKIAQWRRERDDGSLYYETSENNMNKELDTISNFAKMDAIRKGINPADIGVVRQDDGTYWTKNSDNTFTQLNVTNP